MKRALLGVGLGVVVTTMSVSAQADEPGQIDVHRAPLPDDRIAVHEVHPYPTFPWLLFQLLPSPELAFGKTKVIDATGKVDDSIRTAFGLRWQVTPLLWSFGVHHSQSRWRYFVVDPFARHSGSIELSTSFEWIGGHYDGLIARPGVRVYLPVLEKGEKLSTSLGTSIYAADGLRVAYDAGIYVLNGFLGLQVTVAPRHQPLATIATLRIRYF